MSKLPALESAQLQQVLDNELPVLLDFWAPWCQPCKTLAPILEAVAGEYGERLSCLAVDIDVAGDLARRFSVAGVPTLLLLHKGEVVARHVGVLSRLRLREFIDQAMS
ncbi:thioredoxin family protein [Frateuria aurantia]